MVKALCQPRKKNSRWAARHVPTDIAGKINAEVVAELKSPEPSEHLTQESANPVGNSPAKFGKYIQSEIEKWRKVI